MPNFTYTQNIPDGPNDPSADQPNMKINTNSIASIMAVEHFGFGNNNGGLHQQATFPLRSGSPATVAGQLALFSTNLVGGQPAQLFYTHDAGTVFAITGNKDPVASGNGFTSLPGPSVGTNAGIYLQWGSITGAPIVNGQAVGFSFTFPNNVFSITFAPTSNSTNDKTISITTGSVTTAGFTVSCSGTSSFQTLYWMAIGN